VQPPPTLRWDEGRLFLLDQTLLPHHVVEVEQVELEQVRSSIQRLVVRGAPAIGVAAAYGLVVSLRADEDGSAADLLAAAEAAGARLRTARPTAVNLAWAVDRMLARARAAQPAAASGAELLAALEAEAVAIHEEDVACCRAIGEHGAHLVPDGGGVLTHCNAGALATSGIGTALAPMYVAHERGVRFRAYADETRPLLQGARLTAFELGVAGIDVTVLVDGAAASVLASGDVQLVVVGADRVAANGDVANKVGTFGVALAARHAGVPFYVACPWSTIDLATPTGADIVVEERGGDEVTSFAETNVAPLTAKARNPAFDVTPASLVTGLITEQGIVAPDGLAAARAASHPS
jgi:methylthioribose-1-phosphate isomerase